MGDVRWVMYGWGGVGWGGVGWGRGVGRGGVGWVPLLLPSGSSRTRVPVAPVSRASASGSSPRLSFGAIRFEDHTPNLQHTSCRAGHDVNDYEIGKRCSLPIINIMNKDATLNAAAGKYAGLERFAARKALWADMEAAGLVIKKEPHTSRSVAWECVAFG